MIDCYVTIAKRWCVCILVLGMESKYKRERHEGLEREGRIINEEKRKEQKCTVAGGQEEKSSEEVCKRGKVMGKTKQEKRRKRQRVGFREGRRGSGVVSFNWASGFGTHSDNIKGQIYIKHCWEMSTNIGNGCRAESQRDQERPLAADMF